MKLRVSAGRASTCVEQRARSLLVIVSWRARADEVLRRQPLDGLGVRRRRIVRRMISR